MLDFEHAATTARALDVAASLRIIVNTWEQPLFWHRIQAFWRGYSRRIRLTANEIRTLPWLIRLRNVMFLLLRLGCQRNFERIPAIIENCQHCVRWFERHEAQFFEVVRQGIA